MNNSWFMQAQSEPIARDANREDECTDARPCRNFFEVSFESQALLSDEPCCPALLMWISIRSVPPLLLLRLQKPVNSPAFKQRIEVPEKVKYPGN